MTKPASPPTVSQQQCDKFRSLLSDMFQTGRSDLDFGIYRILSKKREVIEKFLDTELHQLVNNSISDEQQSVEVFNHLLEFFGRYFDSGDYVPRRHYMSAGNESYYIPYNGEEVLLYWANSDQYYIKTSENYFTYSFKLQNNKKVRFEISKADVLEGDTVRSKAKSNKFVLANDPVEIEGGGGF